ncbi:hypothetical protein CMQ_6401 [Grosmannia clavigera kw1407]|uniref:Uncharacterized protein n=1 Tax=Grosmannia clavigera (strain kw1407 / UAMH 11150) TaxID=655863 RepID=F0XLS3_GROCL|nr:uncharacterized protein CMQ_6401 [Grosmannia clavigera kw1407]EFX01459.1 hypothetical protein CMQ_6401 [Grosmannia clavigera kw1407]
MGLIDAPNKVPYFQRTYQAAFRGHTRLWKINPRSNVLLTPYMVILFGSAAATTYGMTRKVLGYNTFW